MLSRRSFLKRSTGALLGSAVFLPARGQSIPPGQGAPFRLLYGNDTTNLVECTSPSHPKGAPFDPAMIGASIDEARGADAHFLQPGLTWVPMWKSKQYPAADHFRWWRETFRGRMHPLGEYLLGGGDVVQEFVRHCRQRHVAPFISVRLNDYHRIESLDVPAGTRLQPFDSLGMDRFRRAHPEWRLAPPPDKTGAVAAAPSEQRYDAVFAAREGQVMPGARSMATRRNSRARSRPGKRSRSISSSPNPLPEKGRSGCRPRRRWTARNGKPLARARRSPPSPTLRNPTALPIPPCWVSQRPCGPGASPSLC